MHRATPSDSSHRAYSAGGRVGVGKSVSDKNGIQTCSSGMMKNESRDDIEAPQNYGFTSVCRDADENGQGPECMMSYMGGNGSFPVCSSMDDRRERLKGLDEDAAKGSSAMYGLRKWGQQLLNTETGWYMTGNKEKKTRFQLVENDKYDQQQQGGQGGQGGSGGGTAVSALAEGGGSGGGAGGQGGDQDDSKMGQKSLHKKETDIFIEHDSKRQHMGHGDGQHWLDKDMSLGYHKDKDKSYRADKSHSHIQHAADNTIFVTPGGCFSTKEIVIAPDNCQSGSGAALFEEPVPVGWHLAHVVAPLAQNTHTASLNYINPLGLSGESLTLKYVNPLALDGSGNLMLKRVDPLGLDGSGNLKLKFTSPLILDGSGNLTVTPDPALGGLAPINNPVFTGDPRAPTPAAGDNDTSIATTAWVRAITDLLAPKASPVLTGLPQSTTVPVGGGNDNNDTIATTRFVALTETLMRQEIINTLMARIDELQARIDSLEARLA